VSRQGGTTTGQNQIKITIKFGFKSNPKIPALYSEVDILGMNIKTNWRVVTGGPSSGKTKVIEYLAFLGYRIFPEAARLLLDIEQSKGKTIKELRKNEIEFQKKVLQMKIEAERRLPPKQIIFFDRGIPDSIAYYRLYRENPAPVIKASQKRKYKKVFLLEQLPFEKDYARIEDEDFAKNIQQLLYQSYLDLGYEVVKVPLGTIEERVKFILAKTQPYKKVANIVRPFI